MSLSEGCDILQTPAHDFTVWMYWEDQIGPRGRIKKKPAYYDLCQETVLRHNSNARIIDKTEASSLLGGLPPELDGVYVAHRSDWIRKMILWKYGGLYVDSDFICFEPLHSIARLASNFDFVGYKEWNGGYMDNFIAARAGSRLMRAAADEALRRIRCGNLAWTDTSTASLEAAFNRYRWKTKWIELPTHLVNPVSVVDSSWFTYEGPHQGAEHRDTCLGYMTSFHSLRHWAADQSREALLGGNARACHILRRGLGLCETPPPTSNGHVIPAQ
jgi:Glycosyltransferase sugar-binding region containing DXD motif